jgi:asparagine synthase (glutamine-hydrolysing)
VPEEVLLDPAATARGLFEPAAVRKMIAEHRAGEDRSQRLWAMINLELWFRTCVDRAPVTEEGLPAL